MRTGTSPFLALKIGHRYFKEQRVTKKAELSVFAEKLEEKYKFL